MGYTDALTGATYNAWLDAVATGRVRSSKSLDPFQTSMRRVGTLAPSLLALAANRRPIHSDEQQRLVDLRNAGLVDETNLSELGRNVVRLWNEYRAGERAQDDNAILQESSILRNTILINEALRLGIEQYVEYVQRWRMLRKAFAPIDAVGNGWFLYAYSYYDREESGFNPWRILGTQPITSFVAPGNPSPDNRQRKLDDAINEWATRATGRREFCAAMECCVLGGGIATRAFLESITI